MWIFTTDGFFSVVQHKDDSNILQIRGRVRADLENLAGKVGYDSDDVFEIDGADYLYRLNLPRGTFAGYMLEAVDDITYTTDVKGTLSKDDKPRKRALMSIWRAMSKLQPRPPYMTEGDFNAAEARSMFDSDGQPKPGAFIPIDDDGLDDFYDAEAAAEAREGEITAWETLG